jgi:hypothetical protein
VSVPLAKILLPASGAVMLAALLYLGAGLGVTVLSALLRDVRGGRESGLTRADLPLLLGIVLSGAVVGPVLLLVGLHQLSAVSSSANPWCRRAACTTGCNGGNVHDPANRDRPGYADRRARQDHDPPRRRWAVADARLHVAEFRGFEAFCEGRPFWEIPGITARVCGICPVSHLLASSKAGDALLSVIIPPTAAKLRRLMNLAQIVQSHALSFFHLAQIARHSSRGPRSPRVS